MTESTPTKATPAWPKERPDAETMLRYLAGWGLATNVHLWQLPMVVSDDGAVRDPVVGWMTNALVHQVVQCHDTYLLLDAIRSLDPARADELAGHLWGFAQAGEWGEWLWDWCTDRGLDPEAITAEARSELRVPIRSDGVNLIAAERRRQVEDEGRTAEVDDRYRNGELKDAAIAYAMASDDRAGEGAGDFWPWDVSSWKPSPEDPIRDLVKAGALIAAEIDRRRRLDAGRPGGDS